MKSISSLITKLAAVALLTSGASALAAPINGQISFSGDVTMNGPVTTATAFTVFSNATVAGGNTGDFVGTAGSAVTLTPFQFDPVLAPSPVAPVWTFTAGADTYSFELQNIVSVTRQNLGAGLFQLSVAGTGIASKTGFDDTFGSFSITTTGDPIEQELGFAAFTFATGRDVPDAGSTALLGLAGFALIFFGVRRGVGSAA